MPKRFLHIALAFLLLSACGRHHVYSPSLLRADSLCRVLPDSALALLQQLSSQMPSAPEPDRMFHQLLCIKAADKADRPISQCDSTILRLIDYYENGGDPAKLAETYYYAGRIYFEKQDAPQALDYYLKAMDNIGICEDSVRIKSVLLSQIGYIYHYQEIDSVARIWFEKACEFAVEHHDTLSLIFGLRDKANTYKNNEDSRKRENDLDKALLLCDKTNNRLMANVVKSQIANLYIDEGRFVEAKKLLMPIKDELTSIGKSAVYSMCAKIYYGIGLQDSAKYYSKILLQEGTLYTKESSSKRLAEIALKESRPQQAIEYLSINKALNDTLKLLQAKESIARANAAYNYQKHEKENQKLRIKNLAAHNQIIVLFLIAVIILFAFLFMISRYRRYKYETKIKMYNLEKAIERQRLLDDENIKCSEAEIADLDQKINQPVKLSTNLIQELNEKKISIVLRKEESVLEIQKHQNRYAVLKNSRIYNDIITMLNDPNKENKLTKEQWKQLDETVNNIFEGFGKQLFRLCKLSETEYRISLLLKIGVTPINISHIICLSPQAVSSTRSRLYRKAFGKKGKSADWDTFVKSI